MRSAREGTEGGRERRKAENREEGREESESKRQDEEDVGGERKVSIN